MACNICGESRFANAAQLRCHGYTNHAKFSCNCNKKFMDEEGLDNHKKIMEENAKSHKCSVCCRSFDSKYALHQHKRSKQHWMNDERKKAELDTKRVFCDDSCGRSFKTESALADHKRDILVKYGITDKTCRACGKTFLNKDRLDQHRKDTRHSSKSTSRVKEYFDNYHKDAIAISKTDKKEAVKVVDEILRKIMGHVWKSDGGEIYSPNVVRAGSYPVKTKIGKADEFDTNIPCNIVPDDTITRGTVDFEYQPADEKTGKSNNMNIEKNLTDVPGGKEIPMGYALVPVKDGSVPNQLTYKGYLVARKVKQDLYKKIKSAIEEVGLENVHESRNAHGPAVTLTISRGPGLHDISVDVTPSIPCQVPVSDNGWPRPSTRKAFGDEVIDGINKAGTHLVPKGDTLWAVSYSKAEKEAFSNIDKGNGCRKEVCRVMKKIVQDCKSRSEDGLPGISSFIIKHLILWQAEKHPDQSYWQQGNLFNCLKDAMGDQIVALDRGKLPNYFSNSENILKGKKRQDLRSLSQEFKNVREMIIHM